MCTPAPHKDFSDLYEKMSSRGESASEAHLLRPDVEDVAERFDDTPSATHEVVRRPLLAITVPARVARHHIRCVTVTKSRRSDTCVCMDLRSRRAQMHAVLTAPACEAARHTVLGSQRSCRALEGALAAPAAGEGSDRRRHSLPQRAVFRRGCQTTAFRVASPLSRQFLATSQTALVLVAGHGATSTAAARALRLRNISGRRRSCARNNALRSIHRADFSRGLVLNRYPFSSKKSTCCGSDSGAQSSQRSG